jgi:hypothetical protein
MEAALLFGSNALDPTLVGVDLQQKEDNPYF